MTLDCFESLFGIELFVDPWLQESWPSLPYIPILECNHKIWPLQKPFGIRLSIDLTSPKPGLLFHIY